MVRAEVTLRTRGGLKIATKTVGKGYSSDMPVEWSESTIEVGRTFLQKALGDIEAALDKSISTHIGEPIEA